MTLQELISRQNKVVPSTDQNFTAFWNNNNHNEWIKQETVLYQSRINPVNAEIEIYFRNIDYTEVENLNVEDFYSFLYNCYFVWKYTAKNRLATTRASLKKHLDNLDTLSQIKDNIFTFDRKNIRQGLEIATSIKGLGVAGASGLLAVLFPADFGTVDQFVVKSLLIIDNIENKSELLSMNPESLKINDGVTLIKMLKDKAQRLNDINYTDYWTPRKVDQVLWAYRV